MSAPAAHDRAIAGRHQTIDSPELGRPVHLWTFGWFGQPLIVMPSAAGMAHEWQQQGMIDALAPLLRAGRIKLYCPETNVAEAWMHGTIQNFHKSGAKDDMSNYRGITLLDVVGKLFHQVLANRLLRHAEASGLLPTAQNAFRRGRSCDERIYCISQVAQGRQRMRLPTHAFFLDE
jgi:hypothetical protein